MATSKTAKPSPSQLDALTHMAAAPDARIHRIPGGFWTCTGIPTTRCTNRASGTYDVPSWYVPTHTIRALEARGWIARANVHAEDWRDERVLTDAGRALIHTETV